MNEDLKKAFFSAKIRSIVLLGSIILYAVVVELAKVYGSPSMIPALGDKDLLRIVKYFLIMWTIVDVIVVRLRKYLLSKLESRGRYTRQDFIKYMVVSQLIVDSICCSVAVKGMVLFFLGGRSTDFYPFIVVSLILMMVHFPRYIEWEERIETFPARARDSIESS